MRVCISVISLCLLAALPAVGQEPNTGTLDLQFDLHTHPGGAPANPALGLVTINVHLTISTAGIRVDRDGKFSFQSAGQYRLDSFAAGAVTVQNNEQRHDALKGTGSIAEDRTLTLKLEWTHGPGLLIYTTSPGGTYSAVQPVVPAPHAMEWQLAPASRRLEELGEEDRREEFTYRSRRASTVIGTQAAPMTERVHVRYVRDVKIVPRG